RSLLWCWNSDGQPRSDDHDRSFHYFCFAGSFTGRSQGTAGSGARFGGHALESTIKVVVPYARAGIAGSIFLAMARALGETMAVTMVIGNEPRIAASLLAPGYTIASVIANEFTEATG